MTGNDLFVLSIITKWSVLALGQDERPEDSSDILELPVGEQVRVVCHVRANPHLCRAHIGLIQEELL